MYNRLFAILLLPLCVGWYFSTSCFSRDRSRKVLSPICCCFRLLVGLSQQGRRRTGIPSTETHFRMDFPWRFHQYMIVDLFHKQKLFVCSLHHKTCPTHSCNFSSGYFVFKGKTFLSNFGLENVMVVVVVVVPVCINVYVAFVFFFWFFFFWFLLVFFFLVFDWF